MPTYAIIGAAGYIAPRHLKAIADTGGTLVAAFDPHDSVGHLDQYFPDAAFFTELERFDRHLEKQKQGGQPIDYLCICSPNYLHDAHIRFGLRHGAEVICEKPLVLNTHNALRLLETEAQTGKKVNTILQLRLQPSLQALKPRIEQRQQHQDVTLTYITARGNWYYASWKGDPSKSGGIATNIGIHFFDLLTWLFGEVRENTVHLHTHDRAAGRLEFPKATVRWFLSIHPDTLPEHIRARGQRTYRQITIDDEPIEFSEGFTELHTKSYEAILNGQGFGIHEILPATALAEHIRKSTPIGAQENKVHPLVQLPTTSHPFTSTE
ncbi:MAG: Gfo/Idh/MocA family protein [Chitinophagales bacterium]